MVRRLTLVGIFVTIQQGSIVQVIIGTTFSAAYMLIQMQVGPYDDTSDDYLANFCSFSLLVVFLCCILYKQATLIELQDVRGVISEEQKRDFAFDSLGLSIVLGVFVVAVLVASFLVLIVKLAHERERIQREKRAAKMRRLRFKIDGAEVVVPPIQSKHFHIFLSHVSEAAA